MEEVGKKIFKDINPEEECRYTKLINIYYKKISKLNI